MPGGWLDGKTGANIGGVVAVLEWAERECGAGSAWMCRGVVMLRLGTDGRRSTWDLMLG